MLEVMRGATNDFTSGERAAFHDGEGRVLLVNATYKKGWEIPADM